VTIYNDDGQVRLPLRKCAATAFPLLLLSIFWIAWGVPASLGFRLAFGLGFPLDTGPILSPSAFLCASTTFVVLGVVLFLLAIVLYYRDLRKSRRRVGVIVLLVFATQLLTGALAAFRPEYSSVQLLYREVPRDAKYAPGFTKNAFCKVTVGMHREAVRKLIGRGFSEWTCVLPDDGDLWVYTLPRSENYWMYRVHFRGDLVSKVQMEFWTD